MSSHTEPDELDLLLPANCPDPYFDTWDRHNSIAFSTATKGLRNAPGENNCFVNSAVQVFWHLDVFRRSYRRLSGHTCMGNSCIFCALKVIFTQFQFSDQASLHPEALRKALAETFANQQRFQLGHMDDAAECFENILRRIHFHIANNCNEDNCSAPHCLPHQKFSLNIVEKVVCPCGASSSPLKFSEMVHYVSAKALVSQARVMQETGDVLHPDRFGLLLRSANAMGDIRDCPGGCGKSVQIRRTLLNSPDVVSIGLVWDSDHPTVETTTEVARSIGTTIHMQDVFHAVMQDMRSLPKLQLVGLVCYYGKHYSTFVFHSKLQVWIYFDDATVREIGPRWEHVVYKCSKGRYQPLLLLYANPMASPVSVETAPRKRTMAPGFGIPGGPEEESSLDRTRDSISSQRSRTPNPEPSQHLQEMNSSHPRARSVTPSAMAADHSRDGSDHRRQQSFIMAMGVKGQDSKAKPPVRMVGGQAGMTSGHPGPLDGQQAQGQAYSDYTLSTSDQYRRPSMGGFEPQVLPLTPNMKGYAAESQRRDSFNKKGKDAVRADVVRYQMNKGRGGQQGFEPDLPPNLPPKQPSTAMFYQGGSSQVRQRTLSQGGDEAYASDSSTFEGYGGHTVVKPMAGGQYDHRSGHHGENSMSHSSHTPVQSGLATLPRKKKDLSHSHQRQGSGLSAGTQEASTSFSRQGSTGNLASLADHHSRTPSSMSNPQGLPPAVPSKYPQQQGQMPMSDSDSKKSPSSKKLKKEQKRAEKKQTKSSSYSKLQPSPSPSPSPSTSEAPQLSLPPQLQQPSPLPGGPLLHRRPEEYKDEKLVYIDRRMVESILKHQGLQRQPSTNSSGSSSSALSGVSNTTVESDSIMCRLLAAKLGETTAAGGQTGDASFDNVSLSSHKDSGYGGSDRNSSSSTGSGTIDPYTQYFISKSMVVPRNLNPQFLQQQLQQPGPQHPHHPQQLVSDFTAPDAQVYTASLAQGEAPPIKDLTGMSREEVSRHLYETLTQRKIMHPIKESSQEDILKLVPRDNTPTPSPVRGPSPSNVPPPLPPGPPLQDCAPEGRLGKEGRPPPIPPKNFAAFQVSKSTHLREASIDSLDTSEVQNDYFVSMCEKADDLMDRCILAETQEDLPAALRFCDGALGCLKEAMNQTDIANKALVYAQKKHNSCLLKSRSLFKRSSAQNNNNDGSSVQGSKRSSITSTDSDNSDKPTRRMPSKDRLLGTGGRATGTRPLPGQTTATSVPSLNQPSRQSPAPQHYPPSSQSQQSLYPAGMGGQQQAPPPPARPPYLARSSGFGGDKISEEPIHVRSSSSSSLRSSTSVPSSLSQNLPASHPPKSNSSSGSISSVAPSPGPSFTSAYASSTTSNIPLDAYGTLPRNRKHRRTSDPTGNSEVYQMYLHKQKSNNLQQQQQLGSSGSDGSRESDGSSCESTGDNQQKKSSKAEIRELLQASAVQRQVQQFSGPPVTSNVAGRPDLTDSRPQLIQHAESGSRLSHSSQGSTISASSQQDNGQSSHQQQGSPSSPSAFTSPPRSQGVGHTSQMSHHAYQQQQRAVPRPGSSQANPSLDYNNINSSNNNPQHPPPQAVSGYSQPLPGHRPTPHPQSYRNSPGPGSQNYSQVYPLPPNRQGGGGADVSSLPGHHHQQQQQHHRGIEGSISRPGSSTGHPMPYNYSNATSSSNNNYSNATSSSNSNSRPQPPNVQGLAQGLNNLNVNSSSNNRRHSGGPPPPPPTRTSSNPDFPMNIKTSPSSSSTPSSNIARVQPNSHFSSSQPGRVNSPFLTSAQAIPTPSRHVAGSVPPQVPQLKHATSSTGLNYLPQTGPRPLERSSSQPDVQHLGVSPYSDILIPSHTTSHAYSSNLRAQTDPSGANLNLAQTSEHPDQQQAAESTPSVRALASQFDSAPERPPLKPKPSLGSSSCPPRTRSKSESGSKKPKSVLKSKKNKGKAPRKSVTFAADISSSAAGYESAAELTSFSSKSGCTERAYFSDDEDHITDFTSPSPVAGRLGQLGAAYSDNELDDVEDSSNSDDGPAPREELACQLCRKREVAPGTGYCAKCSFYMSKLVSS